MFYNNIIILLILNIAFDYALNKLPNEFKLKWRNFLTNLILTWWEFKEFYALTGKIENTKSETESIIPVYYM